MADAIIALTSNLAMKNRQRIEFDSEVVRRRRHPKCPTRISNSKLSECTPLASPRGYLFQFRDAQIAKTQIRRRIVTLDAERPGAELAAVAGVVVFRPRIGPIDDRIAVDPRRDVPAVRR